MPLSDTFVPLPEFSQKCSNNVKAWEKGISTALKHAIHLCLALRLFCVWCYLSCFICLCDSVATLSITSLKITRNHQKLTYLGFFIQWKLIVWGYKNPPPQQQKHTTTVTKKTNQNNQPKPNNQNHSSQQTPTLKMFHNIRIWDTFLEQNDLGFSAKYSTYISMSWAKYEIIVSISTLQCLILM